MGVQCSMNLIKEAGFFDSPRTVPRTDFTSDPHKTLLKSGNSSTETTRPTNNRRKKIYREISTNVIRQNCNKCTQIWQSSKWVDYDIWIGGSPARGLS